MIQSQKAANATGAEGREFCLRSVARLMRIAIGDTGQCRRVADFLLAWHNAQENGGWSRSEKLGRGGTDDELAKPLIAIQWVQIPPD